MAAPMAGVSQETIAAVRAALESPQVVAETLAKATTQGISTTTGLVGINLEAPAKNLFPVLSPLRNRFPRQMAAVGATAVQWRAITGINTAKLKAGVAEKNRNSVVTTAEVDKTQAYKDFGLDDFVTFTAQDAARGFMDLRAEAAANLLAAVMVEEEKIVLGGNVTAIGKPGTLTFADTAASSIGSLTAATQYFYAVSALTEYGYLNGANGVNGSTDSPDETDGRTGNHTTAASGNGSKATDITWAAVRGAVAYNVYAGTASNALKYFGTVTTPYARVTSIPGSGNTANAADQTGDTLSFDGLIPQIEASGSGAYFIDLANAALTSDSAGGISELDVMLKSLWDNSRVGPTCLLVNSQEAENIGKKITSAGTTGGLRYTQTVDAQGNVVGGLVAASYRNKFTEPRLVPIEIHPYLAPGTILAISERLPFPRNNVPSPFMVDTRREYTQYDWALVQRAWEFGVYGSECLKVYFPAGCGAIVGIANG